MAQVDDLDVKEDTESFGASNNVNGVAISQYGTMMAVAGSSFVQLFTVEDLSLSSRWKLPVCHDLNVIFFGDLLHCRAITESAVEWNQVSAEAMPTLC